MVTASVHDKNTLPEARQHATSGRNIALAAKLFGGNGSSSSSAPVPANSAGAVGWKVARAAVVGPPPGAPELEDFDSDCSSLPQSNNGSATRVPDSEKKPSDGDSTLSSDDESNDADDPLESFHARTISMFNDIVNALEAAVWDACGLTTR